MTQETDHSIEPGSAQADPLPKYSGDASTPGSEPDIRFPIVGIGASAGGLAAFEKLFRALPPDSGMAFVVVQHLSPPHKSILPEILQRFTSMPVVQVTEGIQVKPNAVYVIPPGRDLALRDGHLRLLEPEVSRGYRLPIDFFFRSLAQDQEARAIGIVLSGTGSDGSLGLKTIKAEGGLTIAQEPETAEYADMPQAAIATREVDFILPPENIGELILKYIHHKVLDGYKRGEGDFQIPVGGLQKLYYMLRSRTGHDFSMYKQNTLLRRIERRMKVCLVKSMDEYIAYLEENPEEIEALFQEMLINVTHFFRDPEAFQALIDKTIRPLIMRKHTARDPLRVWVAGCSSGEEAYSVAIAIREQLEAMQIELEVQILSTDLDPEAIVAARKGFYTDGSLENVSAERLQQFFLQEDEGYRVKKIIRDMVVFSTQNLIADPPFSKIDLLCCRNVLIYLENELQNQLLLQFHYSLNEGGILFLGNSESLSRKSDLFTVIDRKYKIFQRKEVVTQRPVKNKSRLLPGRVIPNGSKLPTKRTRAGGLRELVEQTLLEFHAPACAILDPKHNILYIHGSTGKYLEPAAGETSNNLIRMAREGLKTELAAAIHAAVNHKVTVRREGVQVKTNGGHQAINLTVRPVDWLPDNGEMIMVVFEDVTVSPVETTPTPLNGEPNHSQPSSRRQIDQLKRELKEKDEYLHTIIEELEGTNQDLKSSNEEQQSINEEMQSANEELETSKEELQSINEELSTINAELQNKNDELSRVNNDIYNLLASIEIGTIFLDLDLRIRRFTPAINKIYNFLPADIGRPIAHFVSSLDYETFVKDIKQVLRTLVPKAVEVETKDSTWYLVNIRPYRTLENVIDGVVITFVDISEQKQGDVLRRLGTILRDSNDAVTVHDFNGKILAWNRGASHLYGWSEADAMTMNALDMIPEDNRAEAIALYKRLAKGESIRPFETRKETRDGRILDIWTTLTTLVNDANQPVAIASTERDISDRKLTDRTMFFENRALKALNHWYQIVQDNGEFTHTPPAEAACKILVEKAGYQTAWFGEVEEGKALAITPVAWAGVEAGELELIVKRDRGAVERALSSEQPAVIRSRSTDLSTSVLEYQDGSLLALPIRAGKEPLGVMVVYAPEPDAFADPEVAILVELSKQVSQESQESIQPDQS